MQLLAWLLCLILAPPTHVDAKNIKVIETNIPKRPTGQKNVLQLVTPKLQTVRAGFVGLGIRRVSVVERWSQIPEMDIVALCDVEADRVELDQKRLDKHGRHWAVAYSGNMDAYKKICERKDIDIIYIATDWVHHVLIVLYTMNHGKHVAIEVPVATNVNEIRALINTAERTRKHRTMLENCAYDFFELSTLNMARQGLFGGVLHVGGAYIHSLEDSWDEYWYNWRPGFNHKNQGDVYPTHDIGPDCQVLNIHRGDRMEYFVIMGTKTAIGPKLVEKQTGKPCNGFQNGDQTSTLIRTVKGKTMFVQHDVMTPRPYNRTYQVVGTDGYASKYPIGELAFRPEQLAANEKISHESPTAHAAAVEKVRDELLQQYMPQSVKDLQEKAKKVGGHGGMDYIMDYHLVYCLQSGLPFGMDVYDLAEWCCLGELTRLSIENNSVSVVISDFTRRAWKRINDFQYYSVP